MLTRTRTFSELQTIKTFESRYNYLCLNGVVGNDTFGFDRYLNQMLYTSRRWLKTRDQVIVRDSGCDLGLEDFPIQGKIIVHHMNPITIEDIENENSDVYNKEFLICVSSNTHLAIHYGNKNLLPKILIERHADDTCPWRI